MYPSDLVDIQWIFTQCMYPLARLSIEYYLDVSIRLADIQWIFTQCSDGLARLSIINIGQMNNQIIENIGHAGNVIYK